VTFSFAPLPTSAFHSPDDLRLRLQTDMGACRQSTLSLTDNLTEREFYQQAHPDFSPVGWHLGHIAFTESLWLLEHLRQDPCPYPEYRRLFAADGLPKAERENLPDLPTILVFLQDVRDRTLAYLATAPLGAAQLRLWRWLLQHESQHAETASYILSLHRQADGGNRPVNTVVYTPTVPSLPTLSAPDNMRYIPGGEFVMGSDSVDALDNERPAHRVKVAAYWLDRAPVTVTDYAQFIEAGGYQNSQWWQPEGWAWIQRHGMTRPLYWPEAGDRPATPVCGVSWYEADAYACFVGKRLPTEAEWERAARGRSQTSDRALFPWGDEPLTLRRANFGGVHGRVTPVGHYPAGRSVEGCEDLLGNVWEWTDSWFDGYPGFTPYPYPGYSQTYFDRQHRVLRGGSWATRPWILRATFRNWYHPWVRQVFTGFRCALSA